MKSTGIIRRIDDLGRIVIPKEIRRTLNIKEGDPLEYTIADGILFNEYSNAAYFRPCIRRHSRNAGAFRALEKN